MKRILINLKDWLDYAENVDYALQIDGLDVTVFPSLPFLFLYKGKNIKLGSQKISSFDEGPHTGSVCAKHLKYFGVSSVILNHKECEIDDPDKIIAKVKNAQASNIEIILCISSTQNLEMTKLKEVLTETGATGVTIAFEPKEDLPLDKIKLHLEKIKSEFKEFDLSYLYGSNITVANFKEYDRELAVDGFLMSTHALNVENIKEILAKRAE